MATDIHLASSVLGITFAIQAQHILREMVVGDIFVPLGGVIREAVAHVSDIVHDASFLGAALCRFVPAHHPASATSTSATDYATHRSAHSSHTHPQF